MTGIVSWQLVDKSFSQAYARYRATDWDANARVLFDSSGNGRDSASAVGTISVVTGASGGATAEMTYLEGNTTSGIVFPTGTIPATFTICSLTRYAGVAQERILDTVEANWFHGHWLGKRGIAYYDGLVTPDTTSQGSLMDWLVMCGKNAASQAFTVDGQLGETGTTTGGNKQLTINRGFVGSNGSQYSDWAVAEVVIWDRHLNSEEMLAVDRHLRNMVTGMSSNKCIDVDECTAGTSVCQVRDGRKCIMGGKRRRDRRRRGWWEFGYGTRGILVSARVGEDAWRAA